MSDFDVEKIKSDLAGKVVHYYRFAQGFFAQPFHHETG
jgi:hypothetical protein